MAVLSTGASGAQVADLQRRLLALGFNPGSTDGTYGPRTAAAVKAYQQSVGIQPDGLAGNITLARLAQGGAPQGAPGTAVQAAPGNPNQMEASARPLNPEEDPQFLAFQRSLGTQENELRAAIAMKRSRTQSDLSNRMNYFDEQKVRALKGAEDAHLSRGTWRGGHRLQDQNQAAGDVERDRASAVQQAHQGMADAEGDLARKIAEGRRRQAEADIGTRQSLALEGAKVGVR